MEGLQAVVFVGPSCPPEPIREALPGAWIVPPVQRGDLYRYRLLNVSVFVVLDGVFANQLAVSPREVVDVLQDGAAVVGAASMGALRAADCGPAGAVGFGRIFRLFRRRVLSSEDEVAVAFLPERPYPAMTASLAGLRFALRRAYRRGVIRADVAGALIGAAEALPHDRRSWRAITQAAGVEVSEGQMAVLKSFDIKREDALGCCRWTARQMASGALKAAPRERGASGLGTLGRERERLWSPLDGREAKEVLPAFLGWVWASGQSEVLGIGDLAAAVEKGDYGQFQELGALMSDPVKLSADVGALLMRFTGFDRARPLAAAHVPMPASGRLEKAEADMASAHGARSWADLLREHEDRPTLARLLKDHATDCARVLAFREQVLFSITTAETPPLWARSRR